MAAPRCGSARARSRARALTPDAPHVLLQIAIREARRGNWLGAAPLYEGLQPAYAKYGAANQAWGPRGVFLLRRACARSDPGVATRACGGSPGTRERVLSQPGLSGSGRYRCCVAEVDRGIQLQGASAPPNWRGLWVALNTNDRLEIERRLHSLSETPQDERMGPARYYQFAKYLDSPAAAEAEIRRIAPSAGPNGRVTLSIWAAYYHAPELSLELISQEAANGEAIPALWQPLMRDVRRLPAFKDLMRSSGLLDYWRTYGWSDFCRPADAVDSSASSRRRAAGCAHPVSLSTAACGMLMAVPPFTEFQA